MSRGRARVLLSCAGLALAAGCAHAPGVLTPEPLGSVHSPFRGYSSPRYSDPREWLCLPGRANDPCQRNLATTVLEADGARRVEAGAPADVERKADCFFLYPTLEMSLGAANSAQGRVSRLIEDTTLAQVGNFREVCNLFVPLYRQATIGTYLKSVDAREPYLAAAASDVFEAFRHYMGQYIHGRPVVLMGHSQGAEMVVRLLKEFFDGEPEMRRRLLVAIALGSELEVPAGELVGGTLAHIPVCSQVGEMGCVVAFRTFVAGTQPGERWPPAPGREGVCVNPASLDAPQQRLLIRASYSAAMGWSRFPADVKTPFVELPGYYAAGCFTDAKGIAGLGVGPAGAPGDVRQNPVDFDALFFRSDLGLHLFDFQFAQGDLIDLVGRRANAWSR